MRQVNPEIFHGTLFKPCHSSAHSQRAYTLSLGLLRSFLLLPTAKVYDITRLIPYGRVTSYGHIARLAGHPSHSRLVGSALKFLQDPTVPWHRVISSSGAIADRGDGGHAAARQAQCLQNEGVTVINGRGEGVTIDFGHANPNAKFRVSMAAFGWFPDEVQLEGYDDDDDDDDDAARTQEIRERSDVDQDESDLSELTEDEG